MTCCYTLASQYLCCLTYDLLLHISLSIPLLFNLWPVFDCTMFSDCRFKIQPENDYIKNDLPGYYDLPIHYTESFSICERLNCLAIVCSNSKCFIINNYNVFNYFSAYYKYYYDNI